MIARILEGEDLYDAITKRASEEGVTAGFLSLIGSLSDVKMGYYKDGKYEYTQRAGPLEIVSCTGDIALGDKNEVIVHAHIAVSDEEFKVFGGHLVQGSHVGATAELVIIEALDSNLRRVFDEKTMLRLLSRG